MRKSIKSIVNSITEARNIHLSWEEEQTLHNNKIKNVGDVNWHRKWVRIYNDTLFYLNKK